MNLKKLVNIKVNQYLREAQERDPYVSVRPGQGTYDVTNAKDPESHLHRLIKESVKSVLLERRGLQSQKLYDIFKEYGKPHFPSNWHFSDITDNDIVGFVDPNNVDSTIRHINREGREEYGLNRGDEASYIEFMKDNKRHYLVYIDRNARLSDTDLKNAKGGFADFWNKTQERKHNRNYEEIGWGNGFNSPTKKGAAARELRKNPYPWEIKKARQMGYNKYRYSPDYNETIARLAFFNRDHDDIGWTDKNRRGAIDDIRNMPKGQKRF